MPSWKIKGNCKSLRRNLSARPAKTRIKKITRLPEGEEVVPNYLAVFFQTLLFFTCGLPLRASDLFCSLAFCLVCKTVSVVLHCVFKMLCLFVADLFVCPLRMWSGGGGGEL